MVIPIHTKRFSKQGPEQARTLLLGLLLTAPVVGGHARVIARRMGNEEGLRARRLEASLVLAFIGLVLTLVAGFVALGFGLTAVSPLLGFLGLPALGLSGVFFDHPPVPSRRFRELPIHEKIMWTIFALGRWLPGGGFCLLGLSASLSTVCWKVRI
jgi:hypothetical protein